MFQSKVLLIGHTVVEFCSHVMGYRLSLGELQKGFVAVEKFIQSISEVLSLTVGKTQW